MQQSLLGIAGLKILQIAKKTVLLRIGYFRFCELNSGAALTASLILGLLESGHDSTHSFLTNGEGSG